MRLACSLTSSSHCGCTPHMLATAASQGTEIFCASMQQPVYCSAAPDSSRTTDMCYELYGLDLSKHSSPGGGLVRVAGHRPCAICDDAIALQPLPARQCSVSYQPLAAFQALGVHCKVKSMSVEHAPKTHVHPDLLSELVMGVRAYSWKATCARFMPHADPGMALL